MTLLIIRDVEQAVKQVNISKMFVASVPIAAILSTSGFFLAGQWKSAAQIQELQKLVSTQTIALEVTVKDKDKVIRLLQNEIVRLSSETESVKSKMEQISKLENQLQLLIKGYIVPSAKLKSAMLSTDLRQSPAWNERKQVGGENTEVSIRQSLELAHRSCSDLKQVNDTLHTMQKLVPATLKKVQNIKTTIAGTPSIWPTKSRRITSGFGYRQDPMHGRAAFHAGLDIGGKLGDPVYAAAEGKVIEAGSQPTRGNYIVIHHGNQLETWYMHLQSLLVDVNDNVSKGDHIAKLGNTGRSTGAHLHFQVLQQGKPIDPFPFMRHALTDKLTSTNSLPPSLTRNRLMLKS